MHFLKDLLEYLGHFIEAQGLHKSPDKSRAIGDVPVPKYISQVHF